MPMPEEIIKRRIFLESLVLSYSLWLALLEIFFFVDTRLISPVAVAVVIKVLFGIALWRGAYLAILQWRRSWTLHLTVAVFCVTTLIVIPTYAEWFFWHLRPYILANQLP
jgi:uncharacterized membrane protein